MTDIVALRASPDWARFDLAGAGVFLRSLGFPEDMLEHFVALWDAALAVDYRTFRERLKAISRGTVEATGAAIVSRDGLAAIGSSHRVMFLDDDDWVAPGLFGALAPASDVDGQLWPSVRIGLDYDPTCPGAAPIQLRPRSRIVYTNNYVVSGGLIGRHGLDAVFEHVAAQTVFDRPDTAGIERPATCPARSSIRAARPRCGSCSRTRRSDAIRARPSSNSTAGWRPRRSRSRRSGSPRRCGSFARCSATPCAADGRGEQCISC